MTVEERIEAAESLSDLNDDLRLAVIHKAREEIQKDPGCLDQRGRTPIQLKFIKKKIELYHGIKIEIK